MLWPYRRPSRWTTRHIEPVLWEVEEVILSQPEQKARTVVLALVDDWAARIMLAHGGSDRFGVLCQIEFFKGIMDARWWPYRPFGWPKPSQPPWALEAALLAKERVLFWDEQAVRFPHRLPFASALGPAARHARVQRLAGELAGLAAPEVARLSDRFRARLHE